MESALTSNAEHAPSDGEEQRGPGHWSLEVVQQLHEEDAAGLGVGRDEDVVDQAACPQTTLRKACKEMTDIKT